MTSLSERVIVSEGECVRSCNGVDDGLYQACGSCYSYIECDQFNLIEHNCDEDLMFDDVIDVCVETSSTCTGA